MKIIKDKLLLFYYRLMRRYGWAQVVEDNAGPHAFYYNVQLWELLKIARMEWPSNSPDLNAIKPTWFWIKRETTKHSPITSTEKLKAA
jgi:hypothetical protein